MGRLSILQLVLVSAIILPSISRSANVTNNEPPDYKNRTESLRSRWSSLDAQYRGKTDDGVSVSDSQDRSVSSELNRSPKKKLDATHHLSHDDAISQPPLPVESDSNMFSNSSDSETATPSPDVPSSHSEPDKIERLLRLEMFKRNFLDQLGLDEPPNITEPKPEVPPVILNQLLRDEQQNDQPRRHRTTSPKQVVVFANQDDFEADCGPGIAQESCFEFEISGQTVNCMVLSCHLWVYVTHTTEGASVFVGRSQNIYDTKRRVLVSKKLYSREGWVELEIPTGVHKWNRHRHLFEISTKPLQAGGNRTIARDLHHRPLLVLSIKPADGSAMRFPRSVGQCSAGQTTCCRKNFQINFRDIGWHDWIIRPLTFNARYCAGNCSLSNRPFSQDFTEIVAMHIQHGLAASDMSMCCVPYQIAGQSVIVLTESGSVESRLMNLVVQSCGCI